MKLPVIRHISNFIQENDEDFVYETIETLENLTELASLTEDELNVIGELLSNMYGAIEVNKMIREEGVSQRDATNKFMERVMGSIDT